jgi:hypothetical protein
MTRMKTIALIDTRLEVSGVSLGILVSTHPDVLSAFAANDVFQKAEAFGRHIRTKIVTLKDRLDAGHSSSRRTWPKANDQSRSEYVVAIPGEKSKSQHHSASGSTMTTSPQYPSKKRNK